MFADYIADYMAGPFIVMTYDNDGYGVLNTYKAVAHETAHVFGAEDEYYIPGSNPPYCSCIGTEERNFLHVPNSNCVAGCTSKRGYPGCGGCGECYFSNCLMENLNLCLTTSTKQQLGWRDKDEDGILDAIDTTYNTWTDNDRDGVVDYMDNCPTIANSNQTDADKDWIGDACDNCWYVSNPNQLDSNSNCPLPPYYSDPKCGNACERGGGGCGRNCLLR
jgi:hypothetical protein